MFAAVLELVQAVLVLFDPKFDQWLLRHLVSLPVKLSLVVVAELSIVVLFVVLALEEEFVVLVLVEVLVQLLAGVVLMLLEELPEEELVEV